MKESVRKETEISKEPNGKLADFQLAEIEPLTKSAELAALLDSHKGERHIIALQNFPDPDAISSAIAHQMISSEYGIDTDMVYDGYISHQENLAMVRLLDIDLM